MEFLPCKNAAMSETDVGDADGTDVFARSYGELMTATGSRGIPAHHPSLPPFPFGGLFRDGAPLAASTLERGRARALKGGKEDDVENGAKMAFEIPAILVSPPA